MHVEVTVGLAQIRPSLGDVEGNIDKHLEYIDAARREGCQVVVFPELGITGYRLKDLVYHVALPLRAKILRRVVDASREIDVVFGFVERGEDHVFYNTALYASGGRILHAHRKLYLPTYGMFEEGRYFGRGAQVRAFLSPFGRVGMLICEDAWHPSMPYLLALDGADILFLLSASPTRGIGSEHVPGSERSWHKMLEVYAQLHGIYICFVNRVGFEDGVSFFGGSALVDSFGRHVVSAAEYEEQLQVARMDLSSISRSRMMTPILRDENIELVLRELSRIREKRAEPPWKEGER
jgi:predicted amidohydrolase